MRSILVSVMANKEKLTTIKFRFDLGMSFMTIVNLVLLTLTAFDKVQDIGRHFGVELNLVLVIVPVVVMAIIGTYLFGYVLDEGFSYWQEMRKVQASRDPVLQKILNNTNELKKLLGDEKDDGE